MISMDSFYRTIFYPITYILSLFSSCLGSRGFYDFYSLFNNYLATSAKRLGNSTINVYRNYDGLYIESGLRPISMGVS